MIACAAAGADIVDVAIDSMSGMTSQASMGAVCAALEQTGLGTGISHEAIQALNQYWTQVRILYAPFDANLKSSEYVAIQPCSLQQSCASRLPSTDPLALSSPRGLAPARRRFLPPHRMPPFSATCHSKLTLHLFLSTPVLLSLITKCLVDSLLI